MISDAFCGTCLHWSADLPAITTGARRPCGANGNIGTCMCHPPTVVMMGGVAVSLQPETREDRYCGDWMYDPEKGLSIARERGDGRSAEVIDLATRRPDA